MVGAFYQHFYSYLDSLNLSEEYRSNIITTMARVTPLLSYIPRGIPGYTDHGILHSINVLGFIQDVVKEYPVEFSEEERHLLALASVLHDIGCIVKREKHNQITLQLLDKNRFRFLRQMIGALNYGALRQVILAHSREFDFAEIPKDPSRKIRLKLICPIFRLADACDIGQSRVMNLLFEILVEEGLLDVKSKKIWESHLAIENVLLEGTTIKPRVYDLKLAKYCIDELKDELQLINDALSEIDNPFFLLKPEVINRYPIKN